MAYSERSQVSRDDTKRGLRVLVRRSGQALRVLREALRQEQAQSPLEAEPEPEAPASEQLTAAIELTQSLHSRFTLLEQHLALLSDKVEQLGVRLNEPPRRAEGEGTLRPPKVPQGLELPGESAANASGFSARALEAQDSHQRSGFGVRSGEDNLRQSRTNTLGPLLSGNITGLSLSSLFSLFEFDKSSGRLTVQHGGRRVDLLLRGGRVVRCELDGVRTSATASVREAFAWSQSTFTFRRDPDQDDVEPPQSVNALMLDAMRFHDEELRTG